LVRQADELAADMRKVAALSVEGRKLSRQFREVMASIAVIGTKLRVCPSSNKSSKNGMRVFAVLLLWHLLRPIAR
jgi:hypothetical protein